MRLGAINANSGTGKVTLTSSSSSINDDGDNGTLIAGGEVVLSAGSNGIGSSAALRVTTPVLTVTGNQSISIVNTQAFTDLTLNRASASGSVSITGTGQTATMTGVSSVQASSASNLNLALNATGSGTVQVGTVNVGAGGKFTATSEAAVTTSGGGNRITAGTVSLTAGGTASVGASGAAMAVSSAKLTLSAGRDIHVASDTALTHLDVTSTNTTTVVGTKSTFAITGTGGPTVSITDNGITQTVDVAGGAGLTDFSFANKKNISVSEIVATGAVKLATSDGGANSNITSISSGGKITGSSVTLSATGTGTGNGSIGTDTTSLQTKAASLDITGNGDIRIDNNGTSVTTLKVTSTHKSAATTDNNTYLFSNLGTGKTFTASAASGVQTLGLATGAGSMALTYAVDRAIALAAMDAGTSSTGSVTLTSTGGATGVTPTISRNSGTITAGEVSLTATGTNSGVTATTSTQKLSVTSGGDIDISNGTTLTHLTVDARHKKTGTGASNTYAISSTGLTWTTGDTLTNNSVTAFNLTNVSQSGLNLSVKSDKKITVTAVNVAAGTVTLNANSGAAAIQATKNSSVVTAGTLELIGQSINNSVSGQDTFFGTVGTLKITATSTVDYQNQGNLALAGVSNRTSAGGSNTLALTVNSGSLTQTSGVLETNILTLKAENGSIGTSGAPLLINAETVALTSGRNVHLKNQTDWYKFDWTATHSSTGNANLYTVEGTNLTASLTDTGTITTLGTFVDQSGLDFTFSTDTHLRLGTVNAQSGRTLGLVTTGSAKNIESIAGTSSVTAGRLSLTATGGIVVNSTDSTSRLKASTAALIVATAGDVVIDNALDFQALSITSTKAAGGTAPTYSVTGQNLSFSIVDDGTATVNVSDTTGLDLTFDTARAQKLGLNNLTGAGTATFKSASTILGSAVTTDRLTAVKATLTGTALGSSAAVLRLDTPSLTISTQGNVYVESASHIEKLKLTNSSTGSTADRTFSITGKNLSGTAGAASIQATHTNAGGTIFTTIADASGLDFELVNDRAVKLGSVNVGAAGLLTVTAAPGITEIDDTSSIAAGKVTLSAASGTVGQTAGTGGGLLDITTGYLKVAANSGAHIDLKSKTKVSGFTVGGASTLSVASGDLQIGSSTDTDKGLSLNGAATTITVVNGSILGGGSISGAGTLTLSASGAIGAAGNALITTANSSGATTLTATAAAGGIYLTEGGALTVASLSATSDVSIQAGSTNAAEDLTLAGNLTAGSGAVTLTALGTGSIKSSTAGKITGASVTMTAMGGGIGASTSSDTTVKTDTAKLTLEHARQHICEQRYRRSDRPDDRPHPQGHQRQQRRHAVDSRPEPDLHGFRRQYRLDPDAGHRYDRPQLHLFGQGKHRRRHRLHGRRQYGQAEHGRLQGDRRHHHLGRLGQQQDHRRHGDPVDLLQHHVRDRNQLARLGPERRAPDGRQRRRRVREERREPDGQRRRRRRRARPHRRDGRPHARRRHHLGLRRRHHAGSDPGQASGAAGGRPDVRFGRGRRHPEGRHGHRDAGQPLRRDAVLQRGNRQRRVRHRYRHGVALSQSSRGGPRRADHVGQRRQPLMSRRRAPWSWPATASRPTASATISP